MRHARVTGGVDRLGQLRAYMPGNYHAYATAQGYFIEGNDHHGWTLDDYVLPRLASGLIWAEELESDPLPVGAMVKSPRFEGVAMWFIEHPVNDCPHAQYGEYCECDPEVDYDSAIVVMVGDDQRHIVDTDTLTIIEEHEFCAGCGQIGCGWG